MSIGIRRYTRPMDTMATTAKLENERQDNPRLKADKRGRSSLVSKYSLILNDTNIYVGNVM